MSESRMDLWIEERHQDTTAMRFRIRKVLFSEKTPFQQIEIVETEALGRMLLNDGLVMLSERDEFAYHDMIAHVPLFVHPQPKRVLIVGGGDGGTAREVLRHPGVETCHLVEIDEAVVRACKEYIPQTAACLDDSRLTLTIGDAVKFVSQTNEKYDVILVDSTDPIGPAQPLFGSEFYKNIHACLADQGVVVSQGESPFYEVPVQQSLLRVLGEEFPQVHIYNFNTMTYPGSLWSFTFASKGLHPIRDFRPQRVDASGLEFGYYNKDIHTAAFVLPNFMRKNLTPYLKG